MGAACSRGSSAQSTSNIGGGGCGGGGGGVDSSGGTLKVMFDRIDKEKKGYISRKNLDQMMMDDKTHFQGSDVDRILAKYGSNDQMSFMEFKLWWNSTYTTYGDNDLERIVDEVDEEDAAAARRHYLDTITESEDSAIPIPLPKNQHISNVAVSRS
jgi:hypothetical protein